MVMFVMKNQSLYWAFRKQYWQVNTIPIYQTKKKKKKQGSERIIYLARSKGINYQNSDPNLKAQASKSQSLPSMAWLAAWEAWCSKVPDSDQNHSEGVRSRFTQFRSSNSKTSHYLASTEA